MPWTAHSDVRYVPDGSTDPKETIHGLLTYEDLAPLFAEGVARGYAYVLQLASLEDPPPIDLDLVCELHRACLSHVFDWAGKLRLGDLSYPPGHSHWWLVRPDLKTLFEDLMVRLDHAPDPPASDRKWMVELVAWFQHRFVQIHPFSDFNGRTSRMLSTYLLLLFGFPYVEVRAEEGADRIRYINAMRSADDLDFRPLQDLISDAMAEGEHEHQTENAQERADEIVALDASEMGSE